MIRHWPKEPARLIFENKGGATVLCKDQSVHLSIVGKRNMLLQWFSIRNREYVLMS